MKDLTEDDKLVYEWQLWIKEIGEEGQKKIKNTTALVSRCGGLGGPVAQSLAAAGVGKIIIAHGGNLKHSDLNRQILQVKENLGKPRIASIKERMLALNPNCEVEVHNTNITAENAEELVSKADIVFDCAPLFHERFAMNEYCVKQRKPLIEAAMYDMDAQVTVVIPGETPCVRCLHPEIPESWKREFPVLGAVSALAGQVAVIEGIKKMVGLKSSLENKMLYFDARTMDFRKIGIKKNPDCPVCGGI